eukprot:CAMPEP_0197520996 /NCGR_PEP_ID=MMETSP1318-20131121/6304_1 /TAXON_ID=552666 /ORGANISM="Partenskyella glossopodia, Strain RCC365" /LENGTH=733 /DNA_ID=CAMNT_0043072793 /DNA_START=283 /DNA_END=2484 /DNA_ORIENTATION=-
MDTPSSNHFSMQWQVTLPDFLQIMRPEENYDIHTSARACSRDSSNICAVFDDEEVNVYSTPVIWSNLTWERPPVLYNTTVNSVLQWTVPSNYTKRISPVFEQSLRLDAGTYTLVVFVTFWINNPQAGVQKWVAAIGMDKNQQLELGYLRKNEEILIACLVGMSYVYFATLIVLMHLKENKSLIKYSVYWLTFLNVIGGVTFTSSIWFWTLYNTDTTCRILPVIANVGFMWLIYPLLIKSIQFYFKIEYALVHQKTKPNLHASDSSKCAERIREILGLLFWTLVDTALLLTEQLLFPPEQAGHGFDTEVVGCYYSHQAAAINLALFSMKVVSLFAYCFFIHRAQVDAMDQSAVERYRRGCNGMLIAGVVVVIVEGAFREDPELNFLVRSLCIIAISVCGTYWLYSAWQERKKIQRITGQIMKLDSDSTVHESEYATEMSSPESKSSLSSKKMFELLFPSHIFRGYMMLQCAETMDSESVEFCTEVIDFKKKPNVKKAERIRKLFLDSEGEKAINIHHHVRSQTIDRLDKYITVCHTQASTLRKRKSATLKQQPGRRSTTSTASRGSWNVLKEGIKEEEGKVGNSSGSISPKNDEEYLSKAYIKTIFEKPFKETKRLIFLNNWRPFRESEYGVIVAQWFEWLDKLRGFTEQEKGWVLDDMTQRIENSKDQEGKARKSLSGVVMQGALNRPSVVSMMKQNSTNSSASKTENAKISLKRFDTAKSKITEVSTDFKEI